MELFRLLGSIAIDNTEANNAIDDTARRANDSEKKTGKSFKEIGKAAVYEGKWNAVGGIIKKPTIFGAQLLVGGESGDEAIAPIDILQKYISEAVRANNEELNRNIKRLYDLLATYIPQIADKSDKDIVLNDGVLVARLAPAIDRELGSIAIKKNRGNI